MGRTGSGLTTIIDIPYTDFPDNYFDFTAPDPNSTTVAGIVVTLNRNDLPGPLVTNLIGYQYDQYSFPEAGLIVPAGLLKFEVPPVLQNLGVKSIAPISPKVLTKILTRHGSNAFSEAQPASKFLDRFLGVGPLQVLELDTIVFGRVVPAQKDGTMISPQGYIAVVWDAPYAVGTNQQGDLIFTVRLIIGPTDGVGDYGVVSMYPAGTRF